MIGHGLGRCTVIWLPQTLEATISGLGGRSGFDKIRNQAIEAFSDPLLLDQAHDHVSFSSADESKATQRVMLRDSQQTIAVDCQGHGNVVVWNISEEAASSMGDVADDAWRRFACVESAWAGGQTRLIAPGEQQRLVTKIELL